MSKQESDDDQGFSSPACFMHEFADDLASRPVEARPPQDMARPAQDIARPPGNIQWAALKEWRKRTRTELLARRAALDPRARRLRGDVTKQLLLAAVELERYPVLGLYWPIRGEIDLLDVARRHVAAGGIAAVPVVTQKNAPVEFWRWRPGAKMRRGFWDIPVPAAREVVQPDALLIPLVGFDAAGFRLGYGGGYYDRTLAVLNPQPRKIGVAYSSCELPSIEPQDHDIRMDVIVTEKGQRFPA